MPATSHWVHTIDPVLIHIGPLPLRWYGLMYICGFIAAYIILTWRQKKGLFPSQEPHAINDMLLYSFFGLIVGGRLGACLLYEPLHYLTHPWQILAVWRGGMSSHGGFIGAIAALALYAKRYHIPLVRLLDNAVIATTPGLFFGRIGNFINGELWGRPASVSWAVIFPAIDNVPRHPVQLYQAATEGLLLFLIIFPLSLRERPRGLLSGIFALGYGIVRIATERYRATTPALAGASWMLSLTKGQFYSIGMILLGCALLFYALKHTSHTSSSHT